MAGLTGTKIETVADLITYNEEHAEIALPERKCYFPPSSGVIQRWESCGIFKDEKAVGYSKIGGL